MIHPTAQLEANVVIGERTKVWANVQIRSGARVGSDCTFGRNSFVDVDVVVGDRVKVQNNASLYKGVSLGNGVFVGPHVVFTNDRMPRSVTPEGKIKTAEDWTLGRTQVKEGASIGAGVIIVAGVEIGCWSLIGSGSVVTRDVPPHAGVVGNPARVVGYVSAGGQRCESLDEARTLSRSEAERNT